MLENIKDYAVDKAMDFAGPSILKKYGGNQFGQILQSVGPQAQSICGKIGEVLNDPANEKYLTYGKYALAAATVAFGDEIFGDHTLLKYGAAALIAFKGDDMAKWAGDKLSNLGGVTQDINKIEGKDLVQQQRVDNRLDQIAGNTQTMLKTPELANEDIYNNSKCVI